MTILVSLKATISLTITEKNGSVRNRTISIITKSYPDGSEKRLIKFAEPADVKGTGMLIIDNKSVADEMWIYLPALKKTRRIATAEKGKSFMNSEFSNSDMSSPALSDFKIRHLEGSGTGECWIIECIPADDNKVSEYGFSRRVSYISKNNYQIKRMELFDREKRMFKRIEVISVQPGENGKYIISEMKAENLINGRNSVIKFTNISMNTPVEDLVFSLQNLER
ncbi:MAG: outer membrane lipoprotein-sorting protein [Bacteroidales bacterium]